jgi:hypothetical protein
MTPPLELIDARAQVDADRDQIAEHARALRLAESGAALGTREMMALFRVSRSGFYKNAARGLYDQLQTSLPIGTKRWSGTLVWRHLQGLPLYEPTFGRKRAV